MKTFFSIFIFTFLCLNSALVYTPYFADAIAAFSYNNTFFNEEFNKVSVAPILERGKSVEIGDYDDYLKRKFPTVFIDIDFYGAVPMILDNAQTIYLANDSVKESFMVLTLLEHNNDRYKVYAWESKFNTFIDSGYVSTSAPLRIFTRNYAPGSQLKIYEQPDFSSKFTIVSEYIAESLEVENFSGLWLKVKIVNGDKSISGWLEPEMQCANVYSTCC